MLDTNRLQTFGEIFGSLRVIFEEKLASKHAKFLVAIALMSSTLLNFEVLIPLAHKVFNTSGSNSLGHVMALYLFNTHN